jgi:hypothetical protein
MPKLIEQYLPRLTFEQVTLALVVVAAIAVIMLLVLIVFGFKLHKLRKRANARTSGGSENLGEAVQLGSADGLGPRVEELVRAQGEQSEIARLALQRFAVIRYDAFEDMGGRLSFSIAFLDDHGDGIVLTSINGRSETRTYAKPIEKMSSPYNLSEEEREAIATAFAGQHRSEAREIAPQSF